MDLFQGENEIGVGVLAVGVDVLAEGAVEDDGVVVEEHDVGEDVCVGEMVP